MRKLSRGLLLKTTEFLSISEQHNSRVTLETTCWVKSHRLCSVWNLGGRQLAKLNLVLYLTIDYYIGNKDMIILCFKYVYFSNLSSLWNLFTSGKNVISFFKKIQYWKLFNKLVFIAVKQKQSKTVDCSWPNF